MKKSIFSGVVVLCFLASGVTAQINKITNPDFSDVSKKIKAPGQIEMSMGWYSPEGTPPADLYQEGSKKQEVAIPLNVRGRCESKDGDHYAGFMAYSEREAKPRTYMQTKLPKKLVAGKRYCLKMHVSLSDLSKYATDNIGMYVSAKAIKAKDIDAYDIKPQLTHSGNMIVDDQFDWVKVCQTFKADGTERYVTIGNFAPQSAVKVKKMRRPREFKVPQTRDAYYFVDAISVIAVGHLEEPCDCQVVPESGPELEVVYTKNVSAELEGTPQEIIEHTVIHFQKNLYGINDHDKEMVDNVAKLMSENADISIELIGHTAAAELEKLADDRAKAIYTYLTTDKGVDANRIDYKGVGYAEPKSEGEDAHANAENRRVEFKVK